MEHARLIWCHGSQSRPWGEKSTALAAVAEKAGLSMEGPDFRDLDDPDQRVERLCGLLDSEDGPVLLAGSSMGGYVAAATASTGSADVRGLFLLAPAFYLSGYAVHDFSRLPKTVEVVHGWNDDEVPPENSIRFARFHGARLHLLPDGHRLLASRDDLTGLFARFLARAGGVQ